MKCFAHVRVFELFYPLNVNLGLYSLLLQPTLILYLMEGDALKIDVGGRLLSHIGVVNVVGNVPLKDHFFVVILNSFLLLPFFELLDVVNACCFKFSLLLKLGKSTRFLDHFFSRFPLCFLAFGVG